MHLDIIIPFKNAAAHLPNICSDLENQIHQGFTVHFVSDNSSDASLNFLNNTFVFQHHVWESQGSGPGTARNLGIENSDGCYILFIDADDRISNNYTQRFFQTLSSTGADIVECMYQSIDQHGAIISGTNVESFISSDDRFTALILGDIPRLSWGKAYKRSFIKSQQAYFPDNIHNGEDHVFLLLAYRGSPHIEIICEYLYSWMRHPESLTNRLTSAKTVEDFVKVSEVKFEILDTTLSSTNLENDMLLKFSRRFFKESRILISKIRSENSDAEELVSLLRKLILNSSQLSKSNEIIKSDMTSYWADVIGE